MPVWLSSPGTVKANTVTVRPQVSGTLDTVNFTEGQTVAKGDILAQIDPRPYKATLDQARARKTQDEAQLTHARLELARITALVAGNAESQRVLDEQTAKVAQLDALVKADQAAIDAAQIDFDFTTLRSPISGLTGIRRVDAGNTVTANQSDGLVVVTQMQPTFVIFSLAQRHLAVLIENMKPGSPPLPVQAVGDQTDERLGDGRLTLLDNQVDLATDSFGLKAEFANENGALWPGRYVIARVHVKTLKDVILVPSSAVIPGIDGPIVYVARDDNTVEVRPVEPGLVLADERMVVIEKGLQAGESVVREGQNKLKPSSIIAPVKEEKNP
ncbi:MAG: efflux RND transporter periplasmic adaptor subunit [Verrucomicrobiota bacterium]|nr:efflux RND transporter periplasmic adaptor subunit [Verrucomicrobiota bacterium]